MKVLVLLSLVAVAFALPKEYDCPANTHYEECGTMCPDTCDNYKDPPLFCIRMCNPGCHCDEGYVRVEENVEECVKPEQCPSKADVEKNCEDEPETGVCRAYMPSYYYDQVTNTCKRFIYGGCGGNGNRYRTEEECLANCAQNDVLFVDDSACDQPKVIGHCLAAFRRFYFNKEKGECEQFIYGGCGGNDNNFLTKEECEETCMA